MSEYLVDFRCLMMSSLDAVLRSAYSTSLLIIGVENSLGVDFGSVLAACLGGSSGMVANTRFNRCIPATRNNSFRSLPL